ncbi:MAG: hypothetical protein KBF88_01520 [Polyangiaceae bacterium]|nr:hypothetical protein [Polyangiaceae bacterium]
MGLAREPDGVDQQEHAIEVVRLKPRSPVVFGDYSLDAFAIEYAIGRSHLDFRFELGAGLGIFWAIPAARNGRLRLWNVDGAAYSPGEPTMMEDPWMGGSAHLTWEGDLAPLGDGRTLVSVDVDCAVLPAAYRCQIALRDQDGKVEVAVFAWRARPVA